MLLHELNRSYLEVHTSKEELFWASKMGLKSYKPGTFEEAEIKLRDFMADERALPRVREALQRTDLSQDERVGLEGWKHFFEVNIIEKSEAKALQNKIIQMEGELEGKRRAMRLGYVEPSTGKRIDADSVALALLIRTSTDEGVRKAAHEGLREIETFVLKEGFLEIVRERNRLGRMLGYEDYYDFKVSRNEGFGKKQLFELLGKLERDTREACRRSIEGLKKEKGPQAGLAHNFGFMTSGSITRRLDPYFKFQQALGRWGRSFMNLGIRYNDAELTLDLLSRPGKYENGFMHGPFPGYVEQGRYLPARINFTSLGTPGQMGSGYNELNTLFHEGGHAAHFSNIRMPAPCFSQEFAPTSVAFAETQSMFCDSLVGDADWRTRYAKDTQGNPVPIELIREGIELDHRYLANHVRHMLVVCFAEKAIYEMSDRDLTPENVLRTLREVEKELTLLDASPRPVLSVPHLLSGESSAYYHGYVLAEMAVYQTRAFFLGRDSHLMDNPRIGPDLAKHYWNPGNSRTFLELVASLTGKPFSGEAIVNQINRELHEVFTAATLAVEREKKIPFPQTPIDLQAKIRLVHGDEVIASNLNGESFEEMENRFAGWIDRHEAEGKRR